MRSLLTLAGILAAICACSPDSSIDGGRLGQVRVAKPDGAARGLVVMFSDAGGWTRRDDAAARVLTRDGALVIGVDTAAYLKRLSQNHDDHLYLVNDVFTASQRVQRDAGLSSYLMPTVAGFGEGGLLAELILAQAPPATLAGAVSIDPTAVLHLVPPLAAAPPARPGFHEDLQRDAAVKLPGFWTVGLTPDGSADGRDRVQRLQRAGITVEIREFASAAEPAAALASMLAPHLSSETGRLDTLPLIELPVDRHSEILAILLSGDGGWADIDRSIAEALQQDGVPVVGWDSLKYFWARKTPDQTAKDLASVMSTYRQRWHASKVLLIGYSLGADVLPFAYNRLPEAQRQRVMRIALLAVETKADFQVTVDGWLQLGPSDKALPIEPEVAAIPPGLVLCIYGAEEKHTGCPGLAALGVTTIRSNGAHHFDGDYRALERRILAGTPS